MKVNRKEFLELLTKTYSAIAKDKTDETACFIFDKKTIIGFNIQISISVPFESEFSCAVSAQELLQIVKNNSLEELDLSCTEKEFILSNKKFRAGILLTENKITNLLPSNILNDYIWKKCPDNLIEGINLCLFSVAKDSAMSALNCIAIKDTEIISSDNFRVSSFSLSEEIEQEILLPLSAAIEIGRTKNIIEYAIKDSWIIFKTKNNSVLYCNTIAEEFPDVSELFDMSAEAVNIIFPAEELIQALKASSVFSETLDIEMKVEIAIENNMLYCRNANQKGWIEYALEKIDCPDLKFVIHPNFLSAIVNTITNAFLDNNKLFFVTDNFQHVMVVSC